MEGRWTFLFCSCAMYFFITCTAVDTITRNQTIRDGQTIISAGQYFELGFFSPGSSTKRYFGIWYKKIATGTVVWVANRDSPLNDTSGTLRITEQGILALYNSSNSQIWSMNASRSVNNPVAQLLDTGNLVLKNENENDNDPEDFIWQSFDYPGDTSLPGTKLGTDFVTGLDRYLTSWISVDDPSPGEYKIWMDINGYPQIFQGKGSVIESRLGPWNGLRFTGLPSLKPNPIYTYKFVFNQKEVYYEFNLINSSVVTKLTLTPDGNSERLNWIDRKQGWLLYLSPETDSCTRYGLCGPYGSCNIDNSPACGCLKRFIPRSPEEWSIADWSGGCTRRMALDCGEREGFRKYSGLKLPDTRGSWFNESMNLAECEKMCKKNCSCTAYSNLDIRGRGSGCLLWFGDLIDIREFTENGQDVYIRMAASELEKDGSSRVKKLVTIIVIPVVLTLSVVICLCLVCVIKKRKLMRVGEVEEAEAYNKGSRDKDLELPLFSLSTLYKATNSFWITNKVGEGGYGPVYKGVLEDGKEIAVKRLSKTSTQGLEEFTNEVICISKLQHRNLVKLLGCCIEGEENMLVYEYMPNKSLDSFIFDKTRSKLLDWPKRFHIINGIARGLLYLHQDSILRIIHRDLKAGNILLDFEMEPKISDFGTARSFGGNETDTNTKKVVGTYGYMSPEYAGDGIFSIKSDVFSFGVLVLEIVSGKRNNGFCHNDLNGHNLIGHAWVLHKEGRSSELFDPSISDSFQEFEMLRSIQVGLLCVQQSPRDRPTMASVVLMLGSEGALSEPQQPGFFNEKSILESECSLSTYPPYSTNETAITVLEPR